MATTLGGTTLAEPKAGADGCEVMVVGEGQLMEMADGSTVYHYTNSRYRFHLRWVGELAADRDTARTKYLVKTSQVFSPPESAGTFNVFVVPNSWRQSSWKDSDGTFRFDFEMQVEEND